MYAGRMYGGGMPLLGESPIYNLAAIDWQSGGLGEVSESGYGPYLGNIFDDIAKIAGQVGMASGELAKVASGESKIGTFPPNQATLMLPIGGSPVATAIPLLPLAIGAGVLVWMALRKRR